MPLDKAQDGETPLQLKLNQLSRILSFVVIGICAFIFVLDIIRSYPDIKFNTMIDTFMVAVSLAVAAIPEGLATVVTIVLHRCHKDVPAKCCHPASDSCRNTGMHTDYLFRQNRYSHPE